MLGQFGRRGKRPPVALLAGARPVHYGGGWPAARCRAADRELEHDQGPNRTAARRALARGEARPDDAGLGGSGSDRARGAARLSGCDLGRAGGRCGQPVGPRADPGGPAARTREDPARDSAAVHVRSDPRPRHNLSDPARRGGDLRPGLVGKNRARIARSRARPMVWRLPSRRCWTSRATRAGAGSPRAPARTPGSPAASPKPRSAVFRAGT